MVSFRPFLRIHQNKTATRKLDLWDGSSTKMAEQSVRDVLKENEYHLVGEEGIEPSHSPCQGETLPLRYTPTLIMM